MPDGYADPRLVLIALARESSLLFLAEAGVAEDETSYETLKTSLSGPQASISRAERRRSWHQPDRLAVQPGARPPERRHAIRAERTVPLLADLRLWMETERRRLSGKTDLAQALQ